MVLPDLRGKGCCPDEKVGNLIVESVIKNKTIFEIEAITGNIPDVFKYQVISCLKDSNLKIGFIS